jgi:hypothetical protein
MKIIPYWAIPVFAVSVCLVVGCSRPNSAGSISIELRSARADCWQSPIEKKSGYFIFDCDVVTINTSPKETRVSSCYDSPFAMAYLLIYNEHRKNPVPAISVEHGTPYVSSYNPIYYTIPSGRITNKMRFSIDRIVVGTNMLQARFVGALGDSSTKSKWMYSFTSSIVNVQLTNSLNFTRRP